MSIIELKQLLLCYSLVFYMCLHFDVLNWLFKCVYAPLEFGRELKRSIAMMIHKAYGVFFLIKVTQTWPCSIQPQKVQRSSVGGCCVESNTVEGNIKGLGAYTTTRDLRFGWKVQLAYPVLIVHVEITGHSSACLVLESVKVKCLLTKLISIKRCFWFSWKFDRLRI